MRILEDNRAVRVLENRGRGQEKIDIAINMLRRGRNIQEVAEDTGLDISRVSELQEGLQAQAV